MSIHRRGASGRKTGSVGRLFYQSMAGDEQADREGQEKGIAEEKENTSSSSRSS